ncbi:MAG: heparinase II/III family protein, partial [Victivallales bacterium]|nr:heparinase II/III family protein [Victivallales bacterium]
QCPECKTVFPDNDFEAYWKSGFKDKSLLTGKFVDDGRGWRPKPDEPKYWFVAYYAHWTHYNNRTPDQMADAYERTGDAAFARRGLAVLAKYAERYPDYEYCKQSRYAEEINKNHNGRVLNRIWETGLSKRFAEAYFKLMHFLDTSDAELEQALGKPTAEIKRLIEDNMLRVMANDIMTSNGKNSGNFGMHQCALLAIAKVLDDDDMRKWVTDFRPNAAVHSVPLDYAITSNFFGDGAPPESPGYNCGWITNIGRIFMSLKENGIDEMALYPTSKRIFTYSAKMILCGNFAAVSGDTGNMTGRGIFCADSNIMEFAFENDPNPLSATLLMKRRKKNADILKMAIPDYGYDSNLLSAYGLATLQNRNIEHPTAVALIFPAYIGHRHSDCLDLEFFAENVSLAPDFGYPDSASEDDPTRGPYIANTLAHNTVVVNAHRQGSHPGKLLEYERGGIIQRMVVDCPGVYPETQKYKRSVMVCESAPGKTIVFDVFRVSGGHQHDWFLHSCGEDYQWEQKVEKQATGTLAGPDVPYGTFYDSPDHEAMKNSTKRHYSSYKGSGYQFLTNVAKGSALPGAPIILPAVKHPRFDSKPGTALKIYPLDKEDTLYFSQGLPPKTQRVPQKHLVFVTRRRTSEDENLQSMFSTVWESTSDEIAHYDIERVEPISTQANVAAAKITFKDGRLLYFFDAEENITFSYDGIEFGGKAGALLVSDRVFAYIVGSGSIVYRGRRLEQPDKGFSAKVAEVDLFKETITLDREAPSELAGRMFRVGNYAYIADKIEGRVVKLRDQSTIRGRFRLFAYSKGKDNEGASQPNIVLAKSGMSIYSETGEFVSRLERDKSTVKSEKPLELNKDYWVSECGPGDEVLFPSAFSVDLPAD